MRIPLRFIALIWLLLIAACATFHHQPQPILERDGPQSIGDPIVSRDLRACRIEVREAAPVSIQPRWLPPLGTTANGVVIGTVDMPHPVWPSRDAYRYAIERCLTARGYEVHGWQ